MSTDLIKGATRAEVCVTACADLFAGAGETAASPMGLIPTLGARLARLTTEPDLLLSDGEAYLLDGTPPFGAGADAAGIEGWLPYRQVFDVLAHGRRHVIMGASQLDPYGNQNISRIGPEDRPTRQLIGARGGPGNTINHRTSYWVPKHGPRVFVQKVDMVSGLGYDRAREVGRAARFHDIHRVVTDLCVLDFPGPDHVMRLLSTHPGVTIEQVTAATGFPLVLDGATETRVPSDEELHLIRTVLDPGRQRDREVPS